MMKKRMIALLTVLGMSALLVSGCANKEVVKSEEQPAATSKAEPQAEPATPAPTQTEVPVVESKPVAEAPKTVEEPVKAQAAKALETIYFDFDKSELRKDSRDVINQNAEILLKSRTDAKIKIEGHCDERGSAEYNLALGERRAKSVQQYLITLGVAADRLSVISYGKEKPAVDGHDDAAWAKNRRAEFVIVQ